MALFTTSGLYLQRIFVSILMVSYLSKCLGIICFKCDSLTLSECSMALDDSELPYETCPSMSLSCIMSVVNGITYRGCSGHTPTIGASYSKECRENVCNKGVYPPGRLKCHQCHGIDCVPERTDKPAPCRVHNELDQCYTDATGAIDTYRGCTSDTNHTISSAALLCDYNGCNKEASLKHLICAECDSAKDLGCKMDLFNVNDPSCGIKNFRECGVESLITASQSCFVYQRLDRVVRGCISDVPVDLLHDELANMTECSDKLLCNADCLKQQHCVQCDSFLRDDCRFGNIKSQVCSSAEDSSCWACEYESMQVKRNCGLAQKDQEIDRCYECSQTEGCNNAIFSRCYQCSTETHGSNCATWMHTEFDINIEDCTDPFANCVVSMFDNGTVVRGCQSEHLQCGSASNTNCRSCEGSFCNKDAFPVNSLHCYQCSESSNADCGSLETLEALPCVSTLQNAAGHTVCYEYYTNDQGMVRACSSTSINSYYDCLLQGTACHICNEDSCNNSPSGVTAHFECFVCDHCTVQHQNELKQNLKSCQEPVPFGNLEKCFMTMHKDGTMSSGCAWDDRYLGKSSPWDQTLYCTSSKCNTLALMLLTMKA